MTGRIITRHGVEEVSDREFYRRLFGHEPKTAAQLKAESDAYWAKRRIEMRRELEAMRERILKQCGPDLQAKFRAKWADEDAQDEARAA